VRGARQQLAAGHRVTPQLVRHDRPRLATVVCQHVPEEAPGGGRVPPRLQQHVDDLAVLVDGPPQIALPPSDPDEDLVNEDGAACIGFLGFSSTDCRVPTVNLAVPKSHIYQTDRAVARVGPIREANQDRRAK
jgi:hypothetical protein